MQRFTMSCNWILANICKSIKRRSVVLIGFVLGIFFLLMKWRLLCTDMGSRNHLNNVCTSYLNGQSVGNLCNDLCQPGEISSLTCHTLYMEKEAVFSGIWHNKSLVFKVVKPSFTEIESDMSENDFLLLIKNSIKLKFNMSVDIVDAKRMLFILFNQNQRGLSKNFVKQNAWSLLQSNEYLALSLYEKYDVFPKLIGSCGCMYAVQKLNSIFGYWHLMEIYDSHEEWERRIRISLTILDFLQFLEESLPEPLHLCDVKMNNFGVTNDFKKIMYLDLDSVHPRSVTSRITKNGMKCQKHSDCDYMDCRSFCNLITLKCENEVVNNNLQMVCERIFLGWVFSGRVMVPGLLLGPHTPRVLIEVLEICANPHGESGTPRAPAGKEIRNRLYDLLSHLLV